MGELSEIMACLKMRGGEKNFKEENDIIPPLNVF